MSLGVFGTTLLLRVFGTTLLLGVFKTTLFLGVVGTTLLFGVLRTTLLLGIFRTTLLLGVFVTTPGSIWDYFYSWEYLELLYFHIHPPTNYDQEKKETPFPFFLLLVKQI